MKSILQSDKERCYICGRNNRFEPIDEHHVYGGRANRKLSEKYGLKVYLHHNTCHETGEYSVHKNGEVGRNLKARVQKQAMEHYGWTVDDFIAIFGKSYI